MIKPKSKSFSATLKLIAQTYFPSQLQRRAYRKRYTQLAKETSDLRPYVIVHELWVCRGRQKRRSLCY